MQQFNLPSEQMHSVILIEGNKVHDRSGAAFRIAKKLNGPWPLLFGFIIIPPFICNLVYDWIARNRYKWFGVRNECMIPSPNLKSRFL
jgi:predicted DCC family thiol-disulfide oxidoreductase YuxK